MKNSRSRKSKAATGAALPLAVLADEASLTTLRSQAGFLSRAWGWLLSRQSARSDGRRLRVAETVSLGDKRFVAVVQVAGRDFLVAGGPSNIALLAKLDPNEPFENVLQRTMTVPGRPPAKRKRTARRKQPNATLAAHPVVREALPVSEPQAAQFNLPASSAHVLQKTIKSTPRPAAKRKPAAAPVSKPSDGHTASENAPVIPPFNTPEAFRYVLQNTIAADGNALPKPANQPNGRSESEHTGHWA